MLIAFTGTRQLALATPEEKRRCFSCIDFAVKAEGGVRPTIISGMAEGFDKAAAMYALSKKLPLHCVVPNPGYGHYYWGQNSFTGKDCEAEFHSILGRAHHVSYTSEMIAPEPVNGLYYQGLHMNFHRNHQMVDMCELLIAWKVGPLSRGTKECVDYARSVDRDILFIGE